MDLIKSERVFLIGVVDKGDLTETYTGPGIVVGVFPGGVMVQEVGNTKEPWWVPRQAWNKYLRRIV